MALSEQSKKIRRLHKLSAARKAQDDEIDGLKDWFKDQSRGLDVVFTDENGLEVAVTRGSRDTWDSDLLKQKLGAKSGDFKKTSSFQTVTCRESK